MLAWSDSARHSLVKRMCSQAAANSQLNLLPAARLRLLISQAWFAWRHLVRAAQKQLAKSAEMLCVCLSDGLILQPSV